ncbi:MAG: polyprenyl synthetase family protein [Candidatus Saccharicenans sp.]|nr:MAG: hypothetical protein C0168_00490 [Candidatus Aminicenantes bacterium]HEK86614.1 polyprenyl synthetase family protein [Candidatus Aminicenantes bacterium]
MDAKEYLIRKKKNIDRALSLFLDEGSSPVYEAMRYAVLNGGKRFRPLLLISSGEYFGATEDLLMPYACSIEFIHSYSLIHDDLPMMDNDDFRRGKPSCHKKFGEALALLAGDALLSLAFEVIANSPLPESGPQIKSLIIGELARAIGPSGMIEGQWRDITFNPQKANQTDYQEIALKKTANLIRVSALIGARLAGAGLPALNSLEQYGTYLGLAFQLWDDLQDLGLDKPQPDFFRPNLAQYLGKDKASKLLSELREKARRSLKSAGINSNLLEYFADQLKFE